MKLLYIVPSINNEGGVARVLSVKTNYLVEKLGYEINILTQNNGNYPLFYEYNPKIKLHDITLKGNKIFFFFKYKKALNQNVKFINPDIIIVCDNGLKAYTIPFFLKTNKPLIFESHGSRFVEEKLFKKNFLLTFVLKIKYIFKKIGASKFDKLIALSSESLKEWNSKSGIVIPNFLCFQTNNFSDLNSKKVIAVGRHSYEKGLDRLLLIWKKILEKHPDWILEIYGKSNKNQELQKLANSLNIGTNVTFFEPVKNINDKFLETSIMVLTSRTEGFGMVIIEAMATGLPVIAYDCPVGPRSIITNNENGFLIEDGNVNLFVEKLNLLIENENLRIEMGNKAKENSNRYNLDTIMLQWKNLFEELIKN